MDRCNYISIRTYTYIVLLYVMKYHEVHAAGAVMMRVAVIAFLWYFVTHIGIPCNICLRIGNCFRSSISEWDLYTRLVPIMDGR